MIGAYAGSSGAEEALKAVVEAMVMPQGVDARMHWPVFGIAGNGPLFSYQRRDSDYFIGQTWQLLDVEGLIFDIFIWSSNEHQVLSIMDALENGFNTFPIRNGVQAVRTQVETFPDDDDRPADPADDPSDPADENYVRQAPPVKARNALERIRTVLGRMRMEPMDDTDPYSAGRQEDHLETVNLSLWRISEAIRDAAKDVKQDDGAYMRWDEFIDDLKDLQANLRTVPPYAFRPLGCRDLTAPEVFQLGLSGRVFSVAMEYTATSC